MRNLALNTTENTVLTNVSRFQKNPQPFAPVKKSTVIEGFFPKEDSRKVMAIRTVNTTLTILLIAALAVTGISYYFATANEIKLNELNRQTVILNDENSDLQYKLDNLKSFNNVDMSMQKSTNLKKAQQVIEVDAVKTSSASVTKTKNKRPLVWAIGY